MKSVTSRKFRELFTALPLSVQLTARRSYRLFLLEPQHPGLRFKKIDPEQNVWSVRIGLGYRALGVLERDMIVWFWIGPHKDYDRLT